MGVVYRTGGGNNAVPEGSLADALQINTYEQIPLISLGQRQVINVEVRQNDAPVGGLELSPIVKQPYGISKTYQLNPTGTDGKTGVELNPIDDPNGTVIPYQVCLIGTVD